MTDHTPNIAASLTTLNDSIAALAIKHGRAPDTVQLLAVSKTKPIELIQAAIDAGQSAFGENYPDEAIEKIHSIANATTNKSAIDWHFIGAIQSRKSAAIARNFNWVHSVDRLKVAKKLSEHRPAELAPLQYCVQVNIDNEDSKSGVSPDALLDFAEQCEALPHMSLRGIMAIPAPQAEFEQQRDAFARVRYLFDELKRQYPGVDTLSMGMSNDLEAAIAEGSTIVRVGTALFGRRPPR